LRFVLRSVHAVVGDVESILAMTRMVEYEEKRTGQKLHIHVADIETGWEYNLDKGEFQPPKGA